MFRERIRLPGKFVRVIGDLKSDMDAYRAYRDLTA
jgi:hypothetical protein